MSTLYKTGRALQAGLGIALVAVFALVNGCAAADPADESGQIEEESIGAAEQAIDKPGTYACTLGMGLDEGSLVVYPGGTCERVTPRLPGSSHKYCFGGTCPSCYSLAKDPPKCFLLP